MTHHENIVATKKDIGLLMTEMGKLYDANERWKDEIKRHFDCSVETIRYDLRGANRDELETIKDRVVRLEKHTGIAA